MTVTNVKALSQRRLGLSDLHVSRLALGMMSYGSDRERDWALDEVAAEPIIRRAVEAGFTFFDTADMYSGGASEELTGRLLGRLGSRGQFVVATKVFYPTRPGDPGGLSRKRIREAIDASLRRLQMDYVDLYQVHRWDEETPIEETMEALHEVVSSGKARYLGASTMRAWQFAKAQHVAETHGWTTFVSMQNRYNLLYREEEREMIPQCLDQHVGILPYSPFAQGFLAGTQTRQGTRHTVRARSRPARDGMYGRSCDFDVIDQVVALASERGLSPAQVALAWLLGKPAVTAPIIGATRLEHIDDAVAATQISLTTAEIELLESRYEPREPCN
jgi:1-deoxyxylulose-5-phosphate synthase